MKHSILARRVEVVAVFLVALAMLAVGVLGWQLQTRNDAIQELQDQTQRVEEAATHTEQVLVDVIEAREAPEAIAQQQQVRQALADIRDIKALLCAVPENADAAECR